MPSIAAFHHIGKSQDADATAFVRTGRRPFMYLSTILGSILGWTLMVCLAQRPTPDTPETIYPPLGVIAYGVLVATSGLSFFHRRLAACLVIGLVALITGLWAAHLIALFGQLHPSNLILLLPLLPAVCFAVRHILKAAPPCRWSFWGRSMFAAAAAVLGVGMLQPVTYLFANLF